MSSTESLIEVEDPQIYYTSEMIQSVQRVTDKGYIYAAEIYGWGAAVVFFCIFMKAEKLFQLVKKKRQTKKKPAKINWVCYFDFFMNHLAVFEA